jgi:hypothetical protein
MIGLRTAVPTVGAALLIGAGPDAWLNRRLLAHPLLVWIGLISYPLYLWHWPLLSFATIARGQPPAGATLAALLALSVLLAWATYRFVEHPIRFGRIDWSPVPTLCGAMAVVFVGGVVTYASNGMPDRKLNVSNRAQFVQYYERMHTHGLGDAYWQACDFLDWTTRTTKAAIDRDCTRPGPHGTVFLWGDSYAQALSLGIRQMLPRGVRLAQVATSACPPDVHLSGESLDERCERSDRAAIAAIRQLAPELVVLAQAAGHETVDWEAMAGRIRALGARRVVLVGPAPYWRPSLPLVVAASYWGRNYSRVKLGLESSIFDVDAALKRRFAHSHAIEYVSLLDRLCDADGCLAIVPGGDARDLIAVDAGHFSPAGSIFVADRALRPALEPGLQ